MHLAGTLMEHLLEGTVPLSEFRRKDLYLSLFSSSLMYQCIYGAIIHSTLNLLDNVNYNNNASR